MLPFVDQGPLYDASLAALEPAGGPAVPWDNAVPCVTTQFSLLLCPSDGGQPDTRERRPALTNYMFSRGDNAWDYNPEWHGNGGRGIRGFFIGVRNDGQGGGPRRFADVTDGLSNTIAMGEKIYAKSETNTIKTGGSTTSVADGGRNNPALCLASVNQNGQYINVGDAAGARLSGLRAYDGAPFFTSCMTIIGPNGPSCKNDANQHNRDGIPTITSQHAGGAQVLMGDGAVRFISESINTGNLTAEPVVTGPSPYGIWGALGSVSGGETIGEF